MSFVSVLPFGDTLEHWWRELEGDPDRLRFMVIKTLEVSAFLRNRITRPFRRRSPTRPSTTALRAPNTVPAAPVVVVVVPAYCATEDDRRRLATLLDALAQQTQPCTTVVVDDCSPLPWVRAGVHITRLPHNQGPAAARNRGVENAISLGADVIAFIDSDCVPEKRWVESLLTAFLTERRAHAISGATWSLDRSVLGRYQERNGTLNGRRLRSQDRLLYGPTCNLAVCGELARSLKFDESFRTAAAEDIEFCYRANLDGWAIYYSGAAVVRHDYGYDDLGTLRRLRRFWSQFHRYSLGERLLLEKHPDYVRAFADTKEISLLAR